jgi:hypothetical protein
VSLTEHSDNVETGNHTGPNLGSPASLGTGSSLRPDRGQDAGQLAQESFSGSSDKATREIAHERGDQPPSNILPAIS